MTATDQPSSTYSSSDRDAVFTRIVMEHARFLYRIAWSVLRHAEDAEDAVQEALLKLYRGESWRNMRDERAFLARVVWREALDRYRARPQPLDDEHAEARLADERPSPELFASEADERGLMQEMIDSLPAELREPLVLSAVEEMNSREIGEVMGLPEGTVRTRLMRARAELRAKYEALQNKRGAVTT